MGWGGVGDGSPALHEGCQASRVGLAGQGPHSCCCCGQVQHDGHDSICQHVDGQACARKAGSLMQWVHLGLGSLTWCLALPAQGSCCEAT